MKVNEMKQKLSLYFEKYGFYLLPLIVFFVIVFLFFNNDLPLIWKMTNSYQENLGVKEKLVGLSVKASLLSGLNFPELDGNYKKLGYVLPDGKDAPGILRTLDQAASVSGLAIASLDLTPGTLATESGKESEIPIKVTVSGNLMQITDFSLQLVNLGRVLSIKTLEITLDKTTKALSASYNLRAFFLASSVSNKVDDPLLEINPKEQETLSKLLKRSLLPPQAITLPFPKVDLFK